MTGLPSARGGWCGGRLRIGGGGGAAPRDGSARGGRGRLSGRAGGRAGGRLARAGRASASGSGRLTQESKSSSRPATPTRAAPMGAAPLTIISAAMVTSETTGIQQNGSMRPNFFPRAGER
ncbi:hypothetical protein [Amycolatopsis pigmentata]|uniref:Uncharacterized protein n=1 Tax=Amycolatopsis pigmentata TaxID=450801 RepID=A0ABW5FP03_9PSEU